MSGATVRLLPPLLGLALALQWLDPAAAQQPRKTDKVETEEPQSNAAANAAQIMDRTLPFLDGQTLRYYTGKGELDGFARRHHLTIEFYDAKGVRIGHAQRVSQAATTYYAADGSYLGRRTNRRMVTAPTVTVQDHGFKTDDVPGVP
jgi:hypothetical protein